MTIDYLMFLIGKLTVEKELLIAAVEERDQTIEALRSHECQPLTASEEN
jgi:hypothetical protein